MQQSTGLLRPASTSQRSRSSFRIPSSHAKKPFPNGNGFSGASSGIYPKGHKLRLPGAKTAEKKDAVWRLSFLWLPTGFVVCTSACRKGRNVCKRKLRRFFLVRLIAHLQATGFATQNCASKKHPIRCFFFLPCGFNSISLVFVMPYLFTNLQKKLIEEDHKKF